MESAQGSHGASDAPAQGASRMELDFAQVLLEVIDRRASDLHITAGAPPMVRMRGRLTPLEGFPELSPIETRAIVYSTLSNSQRQNFENNWQLDFAYQLT